MRISDFVAYEERHSQACLFAQSDQCLSYSLILLYKVHCKSGNFCEGFIFSKPHISGNGEIILSFNYIGKSCPNRRKYVL